MTGARRAELEAWLDEDRRNRGAFLRAQAALLALESAVHQGLPMAVSGNDTDYGPAASSRFRRKSVQRLALAASLAVAAILGAATWMKPWTPPTRTRQVMNLQDGSVITLPANAKVQVDMDGQVRRVTLLSGSATFAVARDKARPFVVRSGQVFAQATGTVYSVSRMGEAGATVAVAEGGVLVWAGAERNQAVLLRAGGTLTLDPGKESAGKARQTPDAAQISLDNEPLADAAARFNRVNRIRIVIADPAIGRVRIVGLFRADDPEQFARAAAAVAGARVERRSDVIILHAQGK